MNATTPILSILIALVILAFVGAQHHHGNPDMTGGNGGEGGGATMTYKDAGFTLGVYADAYYCDSSLISPDGPNEHAPHRVLERPKDWAYHSSFRLVFCGVTRVAPIAYEMRIEIENKSIAMWTEDELYSETHTYNWIAHACAEGNVDDPICWPKIRKTQAYLICLESGLTRANFHIFFPGSGERAQNSIQILCNGTDYDRLLWTNPSFGHWLPGFGAFLGYSLLLTFELGILKSINYNSASNATKIRGKRSSSSTETSTEEDRTGFGEEDDDLIISASKRSNNARGPIGRFFSRVKSGAKKAWITLGFENFILVSVGLGLIVAHIPTGDTKFLDPFNFMHLMFGTTTLLMGLIGTLFNTNYMSKITFNFTVSLTLIALGVMMKFHEQEGGLAGTVHDVFTFGMVFSGLCRLISHFLPQFKLLFILFGLWGTFTLALGAPSWLISFTLNGIIGVSFVLFTGFVSVSWMSLWVFLGYFINRRREARNYQSINGESMELHPL